MNYAMGLTTPPPTAASTVYFSLDDDEDVLAAGPTPLVEVRRGTRGTVAAASSSFSMSQCRRWVVNWWKYRTSCLRSSSRTLTFQFKMVLGFVELFKAQAQDKVGQCRWRPVSACSVLGTPADTCSSQFTEAVCWFNGPGIWQSPVRCWSA